jgi:hypothetical protein
VTELGDAIHTALEKVGITEEHVQALLGADCCCAERRRKLNALSSWARRVVAGKVEQAKELLHKVLR